MVVRVVQCECGLERIEQHRHYLSPVSPVAPASSSPHTLRHDDRAIQGRRQLYSCPTAALPFLSDSTTSWPTAALFYGRRQHYLWPKAALIHDLHGLEDPPATDRVSAVSVSSISRIPTCLSYLHGRHLSLLSPGSPPVSPVSRVATCLSCLQGRHLSLLSPGSPPVPPVTSDHYTLPAPGTLQP